MPFAEWLKLGIDEEFELLLRDIHPLPISFYVSKHGPTKIVELAPLLDTIPLFLY